MSYIDETYDNEWTVQKQRAGGRREGIAKHSVKWSKQKHDNSRQRATVTKFQTRSGVDDSMAVTSVQYSLDKRKRWEELEHLKEHYGVLVCEERRNIPRRRAPFCKLTPKVVTDFKQSHKCKKTNPSFARKIRSKVVKGRAGRVWTTKRQPGKHTTTRPGQNWETTFPFLYLWGVHTIYVVLKSKNQDQYDHLVALKSNMESRHERCKKRSTKKNQKHELTEAMTSFLL